MKCCNLRLAGNKSASEKQAVVPLQQLEFMLYGGARMVVEEHRRLFPEHLVSMW